MKKSVLMAAMAVAIACGAGCSKEKKAKDRSQADDMYRKICRLTEEYTDRLESAPDSADWASLCSEYEERLDKISFSYPPDTDLLLTEGQNDTIHSLMREYVKARESRIHGILHPVEESDSTAVSDISASVEAAAEVTPGRSDASRSHGN